MEWNGMDAKILPLLPFLPQLYFRAPFLFVLTRKKNGGIYFSPSFRKIEERSLQPLIFSALLE